MGTLLGFFQLTCGLSLFLYGMQRSEKGLRLAAGDQHRRIVERLTRNRVVAMVMGLIMTVATQSSSATTVMLVGFASAGLLTFTQTLGIILGADIGTTVTVQLFAYKITRFAPVLITIGFCLFTFGRTKKRKRVGQLILGFGLILFGMTVMAEAVKPLRDSELFAHLLGAQSDAIMLLAVSAIFTAIIQSSAATIALVISLAIPAEGGAAILSIREAVPLLLGANIGTCATALISSINSSVEGKRVAVAHTVFKVAGVLVALPFMGVLARFGRWTAPGSIAAQIANVHTLFNVAMGVVFLPFLEHFGRFVAHRVPERKKKEPGYTVAFIGRDFSNLPSLALSQATKEIIRMSGPVTDMLEAIGELLESRDPAKLDFIKREDDKVDFLRQRITPYLARLSEEEMSEEDSAKQTLLMETTVEVEHVGDLASKNIHGNLTKLIGDDLYFSEEGLSDLLKLHREVLMVFYTAMNAFSSSDQEAARQVVEKKEEVDRLAEKLRREHFTRLGKGLKETLETTTIHLDLIDDLREINSYSHRIARNILGVRGVGPR